MLLIKCKRPEQLEDDGFTIRQAKVGAFVSVIHPRGYRYDFSEKDFKDLFEEQNPVEVLVRYGNNKWAYVKNNVGRIAVHEDHVLCQNL